MRDECVVLAHRHARPCAGHPRLSVGETKTWMAGHRRAEATLFFERLCPAMTAYSGKDSLVRWLNSAHAIPDLAAAQQSAEGASLDAQGIGALHRDHGVVIPAAVGIVDLANPFGVGRLHVDQNLLAALDGIAAKVLSA